MKMSFITACLFLYIGLVFVSSIGYVGLGLWREEWPNINPSTLVAFLTAGLAIFIVYLTQGR